jgi:hypoxanthine phosphoribosyltransferase
MATHQHARTGVGRVLIPADRIAARVAELGARLADHYAEADPVVVAVMKGCVLFLADLVRAWPGEMDIEFVTAESYVGTKPGAVRVRLPADLREMVAGRPVLVVDDIYDTGRTLSEVCARIAELGPADLRTLVLLKKRRPRAAEDDLCTPDWFGFEIEDRFVVGYGLDYSGRYRNLPYLALLETPGEAP